MGSLPCRLKPHTSLRPSQTHCRLSFVVLLLAHLAANVLASAYQQSLIYPVHWILVVPISPQRASDKYLRSKPQILIPDLRDGTCPGSMQCGQKPRHSSACPGFHLIASGAPQSRIAPDPCGGFKFLPHVAFAAVVITAAGIEPPFTRHSRRIE
ncbi:hypothetical protein GGI42DRAFT_320966 [Trichoderma sp. SZMC 28013]